MDKSLTIDVALKLSRPDVGSSKKIIEGSVIISTPIAVLFRSPPEIRFRIAEPHSTFYTLQRPSSFKSSSTILSCSGIGMVSLSLAAKVSASFTVKNVKRISSCIT